MVECRSRCNLFGNKMHFTCRVCTYKKEQKGINNFKLQTNDITPLQVLLYKLKRCVHMIL